MAEMVFSALVQEAVSRCVSFALGKREEKASQGHLTERLQMAVSHLEFALERAHELRIRHLSLISRRKQIKSAYVEAMELLDKHKQQQAVSPGQELQVAHGVKRKRGFFWAKDVPIESSFAGLSTDDVRGFEWYADVGMFVRDMESGCSLHHYTFCNPIVRHLLEGKTLGYYHLKQGNNLRRDFYILPMYSDERGLEALLGCRYKDSTMIEKCFTQSLSLRLSESTDIVGVAIQGLQLLTAEFKHPVECAMGELTLLPNTHLSGPPWVRFEEYCMMQTHVYRPDPSCCKGSRHRLCAKDNVSSRLADIFPEQVVFWSFMCYIPALECSTRSSFDEVGRGCKPPLQVTIDFRPHYVCFSYYRRWFMDLLQMGTIKNDKYIYVAETIGYDVKKCINDVSIQEVAETIKSNAINCFSRQPELTEYRIDWASVHGYAMFTVKTQAWKQQVCPYNQEKEQYPSKNKEK